MENYFILILILALSYFYFSDSSENFAQEQNLINNNVIVQPIYVQEQEMSHVVDEKQIKPILKKRTDENVYKHQYKCKNHDNPDIITLNENALEDNNGRECVKCTYDGTTNKRADGVKSLLDQIYNDNVSNEIKNADDELVNKKKVTFNNINSYATFNDNIERNGVLETQVDKLAEIRTSNNSTCGLQSFGKNIQQVYDNLLENTYDGYKNNFNTENIKGFSSDMYAEV